MAKNNWYKRKADDSKVTSPKKRQRSERDSGVGIEEGQVEGEPVVSNETGVGTADGPTELRGGTEEGQVGVEPVVSNKAGVGTEEGQTELGAGQ